METTLTDRLQALIEAKSNINRVRLQIGLSQGRLNKYFSEGRGVPSDIVERIIEVLQLTEDEKYYLLTGEQIKQKDILKQPPLDDPIQSMTRWMQRIERRLDDLERQSKKDNT